MKNPDRSIPLRATRMAMLAAMTSLGLAAFGQAPPLKEAPLRTNQDNDHLLQRADVYLQQERYALGAQLWQKAIDNSQNMLASEGVQKTVLAQFNVFRPMVPSLERMIAKKPQAALDAYQLRADGEAKALLAKAKTPDERKAALTDIANRLFLGKEGDDAAMELAGDYLENFEFVAAERLLKKVVQVHPNPSIDLNQAKLQLAMASGRNGNMMLANKLLEGLRANQARPKSILDQVEKSLVGSPIETEAADRWSMASGSPARDGRMAALPYAPLSSYTLDWEQPFTLNAPAGLEDDFERDPDHFSDETDLLLRWAQADLRPVTTLRFGGSTVFFQNDQRLIGVRARDGRIRKAFPMMGYQDTGLNQAVQVFGQQPPTTTSGPKTQAESQLFFASLEQSVLWQDDVVYMVERPGPEAMPPPPRQVQRFGFARPMMSLSRHRLNRLVAYGANPRKETKERWAFQPENGGCIISEPIPFRDSIVVAVLEQNQVDLIAFDQEGKERWRSYLCEEQLGSVEQYAEVVLAVADDDIYALSGDGVVGAFEGSTGNLHWVLQHARSVTRKNAMRSTVVEINGWKKNHLLVAGPNLVVAPSDMEYLFALDRRTGMVRWRQFMDYNDDETTPYPLGIVSDRLYTASNRTLRMLLVETGRMVKVRPQRPSDKLDDDFDGFFESYGRGALTVNEILIPNNNEVLRFDLDLNLVDRTALTDDDSIPLGNLFSDGERLYHVGLRTVQAYKPDPERIKAAAEKKKAAEETPEDDSENDEEEEQAK